MKVLVACEYSATVRDAFLERGHDAWSCDILPTEKNPARHIIGDAIDIAYGQDWDLMIAHPPCTYLCNSGVRWLHSDPNRWAKMVQGAEFFKKLLGAPVNLIAVENPIMHKHAVEIIGRRQDQIIQPWQYGHGETKATGLWLKGLSKLIPTNIVSGREARVFRMPPGPNRGKERSRFFNGIAEAMAEQWGMT